MSHAHGIDTAIATGVSYPKSKDSTPMPDNLSLTKQNWEITVYMKNGSQCKWWIENMPEAHAKAEARIEINRHWPGQIWYIRELKQ